VGLSRALDAKGSSSRRRSDPDTGSLVGTRCSSCSAPSWPGRAVCHQCGSAEVHEEVFSPSGTLVTHTTVHVARPGLEVPYMLGQIQLDDDGPLVFGQVRDISADAAVPRPVVVRLGVSDDSPWYWFEGQP
jgi:uncharacterized protein